MAIRKAVLMLAAVCMTGSIAADAAPRAKKSQNRKIQSAPTGRWQLDQNGCKVWNPAPVPNESVTWTGECVKGIASGYGVETWYKDGNVGPIIIGTILNDRFVGEVSVNYPDESIYRGRLRSSGTGGPDGDGLLTSKSGRIFRVSYNNGKRVSIFPDSPLPNEVTCSNYGLKYGSPDFRQCWMQLNQVTRQAEYQQNLYELQVAQYQQQQAAFEAQQRDIKEERDRRKWEAIGRLGAGMANSTSSSFLGALNEGLAAANGVPISRPAPEPPSPPVSQNYTIRLPNGNLVYCNYNTAAQYMSCR